MPLETNLSVCVFLAPKVNFIFTLVVYTSGVGAMLAPLTVQIYDSKRNVSEGVKREPFDSKFHILWLNHITFLILVESLF
jgi:hypothetical protein